MDYKAYMSKGNTVVEGISNFDLGSTLECGQCFRWQKNDDNDYTGVALGKAVRVVQKNDSLYFINTSVNEFQSVWYEYFDLGTDYGKIKEILSKNDPIMDEAVRFAPGIRLLRQPMFETLVSFIISANNSIPNIKRVISAMSRMWGESIIYEDKEYFSFPDAKTLANGEICDLKLTKAGYRCEYIKKTAADFDKNPFYRNDLAELGYFEARKKLMDFTGVGAKVADCTILFTGSNFRAFPVDVWIKKIMEKLYLKKETALTEINERAFLLFGDLAGYAQQYLFHYARMSGNSKD
ncbi:MAG: 8-oxoguanine DNA glycosylase [Clostridia bacterium]|nr:8-oxoguanine DNA glycosylase [Clostridia bacterium]MBN2883982.1 8-oxoguanine DNA glycosylase [Clostridia bacterium]